MGRDSKLHNSDLDTSEKNPKKTLHPPNTYSINYYHRVLDTQPRFRVIIYFLIINNELIANWGERSHIQNRVQIGSMIVERI